MILHIETKRFDSTNFPHFFKLSPPLNWASQLNLLSSLPRRNQVVQLSSPLKFNNSHNPPLLNPFRPLPNKASTPLY